MKTYSDYKDSEVEGIGLIPEHWKTSKLKWLIRQPLKYGANEPAQEENINDPRYIRITDFGNDGKLRNNTYKSLPLKKASNYLLEEGDILFARSGATVGKTFQFKGYNGLACYAGYLIKAKPDRNKILSDYLYFYTKSGAYENWKNSIFIQATIQNIGADKYQVLPISYPPLKEQALIANFLHQKTTQIDLSIEKRRELVELLKEHRSAIINEAVTKGINPDVPMKDSGVEWVGQIPEHWEYWKISRGFEKISSGTTPKSGDPKYHENGTINWINTGDLNDGILNRCKKKITPKALEDYSTLKIYPPNSLIVAMYGATIGKTSITTFEATTNQACCVLANSNVFKIKFAFFWFMANKQHIINMSFGGGQPNISQEIIKTLKIPTPPKDEQQQIIKYIETETARIDEEIKSTQQEIDLLKEYRQSLVAEAVTGKIDVRDYPLN